MASIGSTNPVIADQDRIEVSAAQSESADRELASLVDAHFLPCTRALATAAPLRDYAFEALFPDRVD
jgi:hypothetical protein